MGRHKKHRGGQPGNQNARKHGFYARNMSPQEIQDFCNALKNEEQDPALIALRKKVENAVIAAPDNYRILREGSSLLVKYLHSKYEINPQENTLLKRTFRNVLKAAVTGDLNLTNQTVSESLKNVEKLQND